MLTAELNTKQFEERLRIFSSGLGNIYNELIKTVGEEMTAKARSNAIGAFSSRTGNLFNSIKFLVNKDVAALTTMKSLRGGKNQGVKYAKMVEYGTNIKPKKKEYLMFKIDGEWKKVKSVSCRPRPYFNPIREEYFTDDGKVFKSLAEALRQKMNEELG
jgi:hypothetical protein